MEVNGVNANSVERMKQTFIIVLFSLGFFLLLINSIQLIQLIDNWNAALKLNKEIFTNCLKYDLIYRSGILFFNYTFAISFNIFAIYFVLFNNPEPSELCAYLFNTVKLAFMTFGPLLLGCCFYVIYNIRNFCFVCDGNLIKKVKNLDDAKIFSINVFLDMIILSIVSGFITYVYYDTKIVIFFFNSYNHKPGGSRMYASMFWKSITSSRTKSELFNVAREVGEGDETETRFQHFLNTRTFFT